jgi:lysocardiolipin and lysophospholipid acyltransferase
MFQLPHAVYDLTMAYKYRSPLFIDNLFGTDPAEVHINIRRYSAEEIPFSEEDASSWLNARFYEKDKLLTDFYRDGHFANPVDEGELDTTAFLLRLVVFIFCTFVVLRLALFYTWVRVYVAINVVILSGVTFFNLKIMPAESDVGSSSSS